MTTPRITVEGEQGKGLQGRPGNYPASAPSAAELPPEALSGRELESSRCADLRPLLDTQLAPQRPDPEFKGNEGSCFYPEFCGKSTSKPECQVFDGGWAAERLRAATEALRGVARPRPVPSAGERSVPAQSHGHRDRAARELGTGRMLTWAAQPLSNGHRPRCRFK